LSIKKGQEEKEEEEKEEEENQYILDSNLMQRQVISS